MEKKKYKYNAEGKVKRETGGGDYYTIFPEDKISIDISEFLKKFVDKIVKVTVIIEVDEDKWKQHGSTQDENIS